MGKIIIGITGEKGSGKSTLARSLFQRLESCTIQPFAGVAKQCVELITGIEMDERQPDGSYDYSQKIKQKVTPSGMLLGQFIRDFAEGARNIDPLIWIDATARVVDESKSRVVIIPDVRMPAEAMWINRLSDRISGDQGYLFRIISDFKINNDDGRDSNHITETAVRNLSVDKEFVNRPGIHNVDLIAEKILVYIG